MQQLHCMVVLGTRPEVIKMAPVIQCLQKHSEEIRTQVMVTGQHREILDQVLRLFRLRPNIDLDLMRRSQSLSSFAAMALDKLTHVFQREKPDLVLVQGDTTTVFTSSLAAFYIGTRVGHVEAGLRSHDKQSPFPEEMNRRLTTTLADLHFAPTQQALNNLLREQVDRSRIFVTGNPVIDALRMIRGHATVLARSKFPFLANGRRTLLITAHRRENHGEPLRRICRAVSQLAQQHPDTQIIWPVHPNPEVHPIVHGLLAGKERIHLLEPIDYRVFVGVMALSSLVLTDSGGVQEEAPALGKPVLVLRNATERPEGVLAGAVGIVGTSETAIVEQVGRLLTSEALYYEMAHVVCPYGDGRAAERIVAAIRAYWGLDSARRSMTRR